VAALFSVGNPETLILLVYVLIYQQVENYLLAPRFQAKTMELHPAIAFGAALAGGAIGGLLWAFLALPFAATIQASASLYIQHHEVLEAELLAEPPPPPPKEDKPSLLSRAGHGVRSSRGFLRRRRSEAELEAEPEEGLEAAAEPTP